MGPLPTTSSADAKAYKALKVTTDSDMGFKVSALQRSTVKYGGNEQVRESKSGKGNPWHTHASRLHGEEGEQPGKDGDGARAEHAKAPAEPRGQAASQVFALCFHFRWLQEEQQLSSSLLSRLSEGIATVHCQPSPHECPGSCEERNEEAANVVRPRRHREAKWQQSGKVLDRLSPMRLWKTLEQLSRGAFTAAFGDHT